MSKASLRQARYALLVTLLSLSVILLGAYVRLSDAGLGCPDWPGCYGQLTAPDSEAEIASANNAYPHRPVESHKAWKEMAHRYLAGTLGLAILLLAITNWRNRNLGQQPLLLAWLLLLVVLFQAALGMWTVTLLVKPAVVTAHLLGGFATLALIWMVTLRLYAPFSARHVINQPVRLLWLSRIGLLILLLQITLGGWTSTNYAAIGCSEFPTCHSGLWWPEMAFREAFTLWHGIGIDYEFGILGGEARSAIHMTHRIGALLTVLYLLFLCHQLYRRGRTALTQQLAITIILLLALQVILGISNVLAHLPLAVAVAHNGVAALLMLALLTATWQLKRAYRMQ